MKLEAKVETKTPIDETIATSVNKHNNTIKVNVDADYVTACEDDIREYVANELAEMFGRSFGDDEFEITNLNELMEDLSCD